MKGLSVKTQKLVVWLTAFLHIIAFVIAGGYLFKNTESESVKRSAKVALFATAISAAVDTVILFIRNCLYLSNGSIRWLEETALVIAIIKIIAFVALFIVDLVCGFGSTDPVQTSPAQTSDDENQMETAD